MTITSQHNATQVPHASTRFLFWMGLGAGGWGWGPVGDPPYSRRCDYDEDGLSKNDER